MVFCSFFEYGVLFVVSVVFWFVFSVCCLVRVESGLVLMLSIVFCLCFVCMCCAVVLCLLLFVTR